MLHPTSFLRGAACSAHPLSSAASPSSLLSALPRLAAHRRFLSSSVAPAVPYKTHHPTPGFPHSPLVHTFFQDTTATWTFLVTCPGSRDAILVDPALDYDPASGKVETTTAKGIMAFVREMGYKVVRIIETHVRPHISCCWTCVSLLTDSRSTTFLAFTHLRRSTPIISQPLRFGGTYVCLVGFPALPRAERLTRLRTSIQATTPATPVCIGKRVIEVQERFGPVYGISASAYEGSFDVLFEDDATFKLGALEASVMHLPGHTPDHIGIRVGLHRACISLSLSLFLTEHCNPRSETPFLRATRSFCALRSPLLIPRCPHHR